MLLAHSGRSSSPRARLRGYPRPLPVGSGFAPPRLLCDDPGVSRPRRRPRLTSAEAFGFGLGWEWVESEGEVVRQLIVYLEDRRALYEHHHLEMGYHVVQSVLDIRRELTDTLQRLSADSGAAFSVRAMRDACHNFLRVSQGPPPAWGMNEEVIMALGELRGVFAVYVSGLADHYRIKVHGPLARVLGAVEPAEDSDLEAP